MSEKGTVEKMAESAMLLLASRAAMVMGTILLAIISFTANASYNVMKELIGKVDILATSVAVLQTVQQSQNEIIRNHEGRITHIERTRP